MPPIPASAKRNYKGAAGTGPDSEERQGLLYDAEAAKHEPKSSHRAKGDSLSSSEYDSDLEGEGSERKGWSRRKIVCTATGLIVLLVAGSLTNWVSRTLTRSWMDEAAASGGYVEGKKGETSSFGVKQHFAGGSLRSNGTHDFKRTVLIVSIDGLR